MEVGVRKGEGVGDSAAVKTDERVEVELGRLLRDPHAVLVSVAVRVELLPGVPVGAPGVALEPSARDKLGRAVGERRCVAVPRAEMLGEPEAVAAAAGGDGLGVEEALPCTVPLPRAVTVTRPGVSLSKGERVLEAEGECGRVRAGLAVAVRLPPPPAPSKGVAVPAAKVAERLVHAVGVEVLVAGMAVGVQVGEEVAPSRGDAVTNGDMLPLPTPPGVLVPSALSEA